MPTPRVVLVAPNAFKGALSAVDAAKAIAAGVAAACPPAEIISRPMADGGDGTVDVLVSATGGTRTRLAARDPWGQVHRVPCGHLPDGTVVIEVAATSGLGRKRPTPTEALAASSAGVGDAIAAAGSDRIWVALGGSAMTDGGAGLLLSLGARYFDHAGQPVAAAGGGTLGAIASVDLAQLHRYDRTTIIALRDVDAPLLGPTGTAFTFAAQKGADADAQRRLEAGLAHWADVLEAATGRRARHLPGAGAAGGLGFALAAAFGAQLVPGGPQVSAAVGLPGCVARADVTFTGEGRVDGQTVMGKVPVVVAAAAKAAGRPCLCLTGELGPGWEAMLTAGCTALLPIGSGPATLRQAMRATATDLHRAAATAMRIVMR